MDTTSHNFTWETYTFGGVNGSSYLKDVAIINENNIWAVGEIHTAETDQFDSNGVWVKPYNAVHWDGNKWELTRIANDGYPRRIVYAFSENDVWFDGSIKWDGVKYSVHNNGFPLDSNGNGWYRNAMWGTSSKNFYVVGNEGKIAHYNGSSWRKIESGTDKNIYDIYGDFNPKTNNYGILAVASNRLENIKEVDVLKIEGYTTKLINSDPIAQPLLSVWFKANRKYYLVGSGIYTKNKLSEEAWKGYPREISDYMTNSISAQNTNDIIVTGDFNEVLHYNGFSWKSYRGNELPELYGRLLNADYKKNLVCIVGQYDSKGIIHIGTK